ncbi:MAG TPA: thiamine pyrophosphate-binding protein [Candidatus Thermoplasmatota archaeon]|nr:thiamine pyrophosphate-binding protein [Candidatus Thermoplasmatota archaeon]
MTDGGRLVAKALKREGVKVAFTLCGGHIMPIYEGCLDEGIRVVDVRHEQAAAMAADGWARATLGDPGVALVTAGPGVMNAVTGLANAHRFDAPMVCLGGQGDFARFDQGALQEGTQLPVVAPVTKWARGVYETRRLGEYVATAFRQATAPRTGPAYLEVPWDILFGDAEEPPVARGATRIDARPRGDPEAVEAAARLLAAAERPVVIAGTSVGWCRAAGALADLAQVLGAPVFLNGLARGSLAPGDPHFFNLARGRALAECDVLLDVGTPFDFRLNYGESVPAAAQVVRVEVDAPQIALNRNVDVGLVGHVGAVLEDLARALKGRATPDRARWLAALREEEARKLAVWADDLASGQTPIHSYRFLKDLASVVDRDTVVVGDGGNVVATAAKVIPVAGPGRWMDPGPLGCLGVGVPFAMAAKLAHPDRKVVVLSGDGSFGLNGFEIDSCVRQDIPVVVVVANDGAWTQIRAPQVGLYGEERAVATKLGEKTRYDLVAEALGAHGELVTEPGGIIPALKRAQATNRPAVVNVVIDPATNQGSGKPM